MSDARHNNNSAFFSRFRAKVGEDQFDWKAAGVPQALTPELEAEQLRKKAEKEAKRKKEKKKKKEKQQRKKAAEEAKAKEEEEAERARLKVLRERAVKPFNMFARQPTQRDLLARAAEARIRNMAKARK